MCVNLWLSLHGGTKARFLTPASRPSRGRDGQRSAEHFRAPLWRGSAAGQSTMTGYEGQTKYRSSLRGFTSCEYASIWYWKRPFHISAMSRPRLPLDSLPVWTSFNNGILNKVEVKSVPDKGSGLIAKNDSAAIGETSLISIPHSLVLNSEAVEESAKEDRSFRQLLDTCGHKVSSSILINSMPG